MLCYCPELTPGLLVFPMKDRRMPATSLSIDELEKMYPQLHPRRGQSVFQAQRRYLQNTFDPAAVRIWLYGRHL